MRRCGAAYVKYGDAEVHLGPEPVQFEAQAEPKAPATDDPTPPPGRRVNPLLLDRRLWPDGNPPL